MARKRMVSPELLTSTSVAELSIRARYGFVALWMYLDDYGRATDNAKLIRAHTWPLDDFTVGEVEDDLAAMVERDLICRYQCCGSNLLHSPSWRTWQKVNHPTDSRLCPCPFHEMEAHLELHASSCNAPGCLPHKVVQVSSDKGSSSDPESLWTERARAVQQRVKGA